MTVLRKYYTFEEIVEALIGDTENTASQAIIAAMTSAGVTPDSSFNSVLSALLLSHIKDGVDWIDWVPFAEEEPEDEPDEDIVQNFVRKLSSLYSQTADRYTTLLGLYTAQKTNLMNKVSSTSISRFNDTPQNGGDWSDDQHTSNITRNESENDFTPVMDRIKTIQENYRNLVKDWMDEFRGLFFIVPEVE